MHKIKEIQQFNQEIIANPYILQSEWLKALEFSEI